jgi:ParB-like chromosome segregation protein Spo0J
MWILTNRGEVVNMERFEKVAIEGKSVLAISGAAKVLLHACESAEDAGLLFKELYTRLAQGHRQCECVSMLNSVKSDAENSRKAREEASKAQAAAKAAAEAKLVKSEPIKDKK